MTGRRGLTLIEVLVSLTLFSLTMTIALQVLIAADRTQQGTAPGAAWLALAMNGVAQDLREAERVSIAAEQVHARPPVGLVRCWRQEPHGLVRYVGSSVDQMIPGVTARFSSAEGGGVAVDLAYGGDGARARLVVLPLNGPRSSEGFAP